MALTAYLHVFVPAGRDDDRRVRVRTESDARHPVAVSLILDCVFALSERVPQLDGLVSRAGHNLTVIRRECNR